MPTRTPAEKERIKKRQKLNRILVYGTAAVVVFSFIAICEFKGVFGRLNERLHSVTAAAETPELDLRVDYLDSVGIDEYSAAEESLRAEVTGESEGLLQIIVGNNRGPVSVTLITGFEVFKLEGSDPDLFSGIDVIEESREASLKKLTPVCSRLMKYIEPLCGSENRADTEQKLLNALCDIYRLSAEKASIAFGVYTAELQYDRDGRLLRISAVPSS